MWEQLLPTPNSALQKCNLAAFSAKALAIGICGDSLAVTALWCLRETLELDDEAIVVSRLQAAVVWIGHCRHKLLAYSVTNQDRDNEPMAQLISTGILARDAGVGQKGFSLDRWLFWRRRLQELSHHKDPEVAKIAQKGFMDMISVGREFNYDVPGEAQFAGRLQKVMWEALIASGKESLGVEDIEVDVDWVD